MKKLMISAAVGLFAAGANAEVGELPSKIQCELYNTAFGAKVNLVIKVPAEKKTHLTLTDSRYKYLDHASMEKMAIGSIEFNDGNRVWDQHLIITESSAPKKPFTAVFFNGSTINTIQIGDKSSKNIIHMYRTGYTGDTLSSGTCTYI